MPSTWSKILLHFVFSTKNRQPFIHEGIRPRLYDYLGGAVRGEGGALLAIGGMPDHLHMLVRWRTDCTIADLMRDIKSGSTLWMHETLPDQSAFAWQKGYGVFSVSESQSMTVKKYIENQLHHHRIKPFQVELLTMLRNHNIEFDERYVFD